MPPDGQLSYHPIMARMDIINRSVLILRPRQPFIDWANRISDQWDPPIVFDLAETRPTPWWSWCPSATTKEQFDPLLDEFWPVLFDHALASIWVETNAWPEHRSREMFDEWFDVEVYAFIVDACGDEIERVHDGDVPR